MNIDVHAHYLPPARIDLRREVSSGGLAANERDDMSDLARRVPDMAERAINVQLLFLAPGLAHPMAAEAARINDAIGPWHRALSGQVPGTRDRAAGRPGGGRGDRPAAEYMKRFYFDSITHRDELFASLINSYGADRVMLGRDYPADMGNFSPAESIVRLDGLSGDGQQSMYGRNAAAAFGLEGVIVGDGGASSNA
jgi:aminocarboxymuconate-semialdehyde decarboxylase